MSFQPIVTGRPGGLAQDPFSTGLVDGPAAGWRTVIPVRLSLLDAFPHHPFHVADDEAMGLLVDSIREQGVREPLLVRRAGGGRYQIVSGHRRCHAARRAGLESVPCLVVDVDDDEATILMVDANLQRPDLTVSERAVSLRQKYEAMKHQGAHAGQGSSRRLLARTDGTSEATIRRLVSIGGLDEDILTLVDEDRIPLQTAYRLSQQEKPLARRAVRVFRRSGRRRMSGRVLDAIASTLQDDPGGDEATLARRTDRILSRRADGKPTLRVSIPADLVPVEHRKDPSGWLIGLIASSREQGAA